MAPGEEGPGRADGGRVVFVVSVVLVDGRGRRERGGFWVGGNNGGAVAASHAGPVAVDERSRGRRGRTSQDIHMSLHQVRSGSGQEKSKLRAISTLQGVSGHRGQ